MYDNRTISLICSKEHKGMRNNTEVTEGQRKNSIHIHTIHIETYLPPNKLHYLIAFLWLIKMN